jgi:hypothetical protein
MTIRIFKLSDWALLPPNSDLHLRLDNPGRKVTIQFNTESLTRIGWVVEGSEQDQLLGVINGRDDVEFRPNGPGVVTVQGEGEVWFYTDDGEHTVAGDGAEQKSFVKLLEPRDRSETLERIIEMQNRTHKRLMAAQEAERVALRERIAAMEAANGENTGAVVAGTPEANGGAGSGGDVTPAPEGGGIPAA